MKINDKNYLFEFDVVSRKNGLNHYRIQRLVNLDTEKAVFPTVPLVNNTRGTASENTTFHVVNSTINSPENQVVLPINSNMQDNQNNTLSYCNYLKTSKD